MDLNEIEAKVDDLAEKMLDTESRQERSHYMWAIEGLHRLAQIKATVASAKKLQDAAPCGYLWIWNDSDGAHDEICTLGHGHGRLHYNSNTGQWYDERDHSRPGPTKPAADRLHELVSYLQTEAGTAYDRLHDVSDSVREQAYRSTFGAYTDAATKLEEILAEGGI